jgi:hypothetical protein
MISLDKSPALTLANELHDKWKAEEAWITKFEEEDLNVRMVYDQVNDEIDAAPSYPTEEAATAIYETWKAKLAKMKDDEGKLSKLASEINAQMIRLRAIVFTPEEFGKMRFLHKDAGAEIEAYHYQLTAKVADLEGRLERIRAISQKALVEIGWIERHPHARLAQTIENIKASYKSASVVSNLRDRLVRNATSAYEKLVGASSGCSKGGATEKKQ